jgi:hypothetical protein
MKSENSAAILKELRMKYCDIQHVPHWSLQGRKEEEKEEEEEEENMGRCISFENVYIYKMQCEDRGLKDGDWNKRLLWKLKTASR